MSKLVRIIKLVFLVAGGVVVLPLLILLITNPNRLNDSIISPVIMYVIALVWVVFVILEFIFSIKNAKKDLENFKERQNKKQEEHIKYITNSKIPSRLTKIVISFFSIAIAIFLLLSLFSGGNDTYSTGFVWLSWVCILGLVGFFLTMITKSKQERDFIWKKIAYGTGFGSKEEEKRIKKESLILLILVLVGLIIIFN